MRSFLLLMLSFLFINVLVHAQGKKTVTGVVRDANGAALAGATVNEKGTSNNVITGDNGAFSISVADRATLVVSFAEFSAQEVTATEG